MIYVALPLYAQKRYNNSMEAGRYDFEISQGTTFRREFVWKDDAGVVIDITGYTAKMQLRKTKESSVVLHEASTSNSGLTITGAQGKVALLITDEQSALFTFSSAYYDLELYSTGGETYRILEGKVRLNKEVTRV